MLKQSLEIKINDQINAEYYSAFLYLSMSSYFSKENLPGFAKWMYVQYQEELTHANKMFKYMIDKGAKVELKTIEGPKTQWQSPEEVMAHTLQHEEFVTARINELMDLALLEKDHATMQEFQWFVKEQIEEEANVSEILGHLKRMGDSKNGLYLLDKELGARTFTNTTETSDTTN